LPWICAHIDRDAHLTFSENLKLMPRGVATARGDQPGKLGDVSADGRGILHASCADGIGTNAQSLAANITNAGLIGPPNA
jgi:hypothetical protein